MKRRLKNSEIRNLNKVAEQLGFVGLLKKKDNVEIIDDRIYKKDGEAIFFVYESKIVPTLRLILKNNVLKKIKVDMGAVKFIAKGADIMRPGIVDIDATIEKDEIISIVDVTHEKPLAIGLALLSASEIKSASSGKVIKTIHFVGDQIWQL